MEKGPKNDPEFSRQQLEFIDLATNKIFSDTVFAMNNDWQALIEGYQEIEPIGSSANNKVSLIDKALEVGFKFKDFEIVKTEIKSRLVEVIEGYINETDEEKRADYKHMENIAVVLVEERLTLPEQNDNKNSSTTSTES